MNTHKRKYNRKSNEAPTLRQLECRQRLALAMHFLTRLRRIYTAELNVREATGHNDGKRVEEYLHYAGLKRGDP